MAQILCKMQKKLFKHPSRLLYLRLGTGQLAHTPQNNQIHLQFLLSLARKDGPWYTHGRAKMFGKHLDLIMWL